MTITRITSTGSGAILFPSSVLHRRALDITATKNDYNKALETLSQVPPLPLNRRHFSSFQLISFSGSKHLILLNAIVYSQTSLSFPFHHRPSSPGPVSYSCGGINRHTALSSPSVGSDAKTSATSPSPSQSVHTEKEEREREREKKKERKRGK